MVTVIGLFTILMMVAFLVIFPLVRGERKNYEIFSEQHDLDFDGDSLEKSKEAIFTAINEIEFDYQMKKLSTDDYNLLKGQYKQKALELLQEEDEIELATNTPPEQSEKGTNSRAAAAVGLESGIEDEIERELAAIRRNRGDDLGH
ncbi:MAG: hypothetical protein ACYC21_02795 [Eubacteriales bacterium]